MHHSSLLSCQQKVRLFPVWGNTINDQCLIIKAWSVLLWALLYISPREPVQEFIWGHTLEWNCWYVSNCYSKVFVSIYTHNNSVWAFQLLHILTNTWHFRLLHMCPLPGKKHSSLVSLIHAGSTPAKKGIHILVEKKDVTSPGKPPAQSLVPSLCLLLPTRQCYSFQGLVVDTHLRYADSTVYVDPQKDVVGSEQGSICWGRDKHGIERIQDDLKKPLLGIPWRSSG